MISMMNVMMILKSIIPISPTSQALTTQVTMDQRAEEIKMHWVSFCINLVKMQMAQEKTTTTIPPAPWQTLVQARMTGVMSLWN
jgi:hypothetical protein